MGMLTDFFIGPKDAVPEYDSSYPSVDCVQLKRVSPIELDQILAALRDTLAEGERGSDGFDLLTAQEAENWTMSVPSDMVSALAALDASGIPSTAQAFADATAETLGWSDEEFEPIVTQLAALARRALKTEQRMYYWLSL